MQKKSNVIIIGAGLAGCVTAMLLAKKGYHVTLFDAKADPRKAKITKGKSYNLQLYPRGIEALKKLGIWDEAFPNVADAVEGYMNHYQNGTNLYTKLDPSKGEHFYQIHREALSLLLINKAAAYKNISLHFKTRCIALDRKKKIVTLYHATKKNFTKKADIIIGADGVHSVIRGFMQQKTHAAHQQEIFPWGYKEIPLSSENVKKLGLIPHTTHRWPRKNALLIGFPNKDTSLTLMLMLPLKGPWSFASLATKSDIRSFVRKTYPDLVPVLSVFEQAILQNPVGKLTSVLTSPWHYKDSIMLIGDAAHAVLPFYGQGMNATFEDCLLLDELLTKHKNNWGIVLPKYQQMRKKHTDVINQLAKANFISLKDKSRSPFYIMQDKIHTALSSFFPTLFLQPMYKNIIYTTKPFADIYNEHKRQEKIFRLLGVDVIAFAFSMLYKIKLHVSKQK